MLIERSESPSLARANIADVDATMLMSTSQLSHYYARRLANGGSDPMVRLSSYDYFTHQLVEQELTRLERSRDDPLTPPDSSEIKARDTETKRKTTMAMPSIDLFDYRTNLLERTSWIRHPINWTGDE
ncbi:hypothetical protein CBL_04292 [Carabus blaptoides fortunei]